MSEIPDIRSMLNQEDTTETSPDINQEDTTVEVTPTEPEKSKLQQILDTTLKGLAGSTGNMFSIPPGEGDPIKTFEDRAKETAQRRQQLVENIGGELDLTSDESASYLTMTAQMKSAFGLKREQVEEAYRLGLTKMPDGGERGIKFLYDEDANPLFFETGMLISVERDDGSFTPYSTTKYGLADYTQTYVPYIASELALDTAVVATALTTSAVVSRAGLPGKIAAPFVLAYSLYAGGVQAEKFRNEIAESLDLKEEETETFFETLGELVQSTVQPLPFVGDDLTQEEILSGRIEALFGTIPVSKKVITYVSRQLARKLHDQFAKPALETTTSIFKSAKEADEFAEKLRLGKLLPTQVTSDKILQRFASLAEQTTNVIPFKFRRQNRKFIQFIERLRDKGAVDPDSGDVIIPAQGGGDLAMFQEGFNNFRKSLDDIEFGKLGDAQAEMILLFQDLRRLQSRLMYRDVTTTVGNRALNLANVKSFIKTTSRTIVPVTDKKVKQEKNVKIIGETSEVEWANSQISAIEEQLLKLGKGNQLNKEQIRAAKNDYINNIQNNVDVVTAVKTPAQMIYEYTQQLSNLGTRIRSTYDGGKTIPPPVQDQLDYIRDLRDELLNSLKNPILRTNDKFKDDGKLLYAEIDAKLKDANEFYATTKITTRNELIQSTAYADKLGKETTPIVTQTLGTKLGAPPSVVPVRTLEDMVEMEKYIRTTLKALRAEKVNVGGITKLGDETEKALGLREPKSKLLKTKGQTLDPEQYLGLTELRKAFAIQLSHKIRTLAADNLVEASNNPRAIADYLGSFSAYEKELLGLTAVNEKLLMKEAITIAKIQARLPGELILKEKTTPFSSAINDLFKDPSNIESNAKSLLDIIYKSDGISTMKKGKPGPQLLNVRKGMFDHIFSETSGVLKPITKNSAYGEVGDFTIDPKVLLDKVTEIEKNPSLKKIMGDENLELLKGITNYAQVIQSTGTDAGSALSGAQLIANLYTLDPAKFIFTVGRLSAQKRMGKILSNPRLADLMLRKIKQAEVGDDGIIREMLQLDGYLGTVLATAYLETDRSDGLLDQSFELFGGGDSINGITNSNFKSDIPDIRTMLK
jgi:hypothetical protein